MIEIPSSSTQLVQILRRPEVGGRLLGLSPPERPMQDSLSLLPADLDRATEHLSALSQKLPRGGLSTSDKALARKGFVPTLGSTLHVLSQVARKLPELKAEPEKLVTLARKLNRYVNLRHQTGRGVHAAMDLRLLLGALQLYMLRALLREVTARLETPGFPKAEAERLRSKFSKLLLHRDAILSAQVAGKDEARSERASLRTQVEETERRTLVADVMTALAHNRPVDKDTLEQAAVYFAEMKDSGQKPERRRPGRRG